MERFAKNIKLKRGIARLLLLCFVITYFLNTWTSGVSFVYADSNDRRSAMMNLSASGTKTTLDSDNIEENIDSDSLRVIALFLSNCYIPWLTCLDSKFKDSELKDKKDNDKSVATVTSNLKDNMVKCLNKNCSFDKPTAKKLVNYIIKQDLETCKPMYMKKSDLELIWHLYSAFVGDSRSASIGFLNRRYHKHDDITGWGMIGDSKFPEKSTFFYRYGKDNKGGSMAGFVEGKDTYRWKYNGKNGNGFNNYCNILGTKTVNVDGTNTEYVQITYPIFLAVMGACYDVASVDYRIRCNYDNVGYWYDASLINGMIPVNAYNGNLPSKSDDEDRNKEILEYLNKYSKLDTYDIRNRKDRVVSDNATSDNLATAMLRVKNAGSSYSLNISKLPLMQFFSETDSNSFKPCFSNNEECMQAYAMVQNFVDMKNGYGTGFLAVPMKSKFFQSSSSSLKIFATALGQQMYVNWIGDLVINTGRYRLVAMPGCTNPYMFSTLSANADLTKMSQSYANTIPAQNLFAMVSVKNGWLTYGKADMSLEKSDTLNRYTSSDDLRKTQGGSGDKEVNSLYVCSRKEAGKNGTRNSLFNIDFWRRSMGDNELEFDDSWNPFNGAGDGDAIEKIIEKSKLAGTKFKFADGDYALFPCWDRIAASYLYNNTTYDIDSSTLVASKSKDMSSDSKCYAKPDEVYMARLGARDAFGHTVWNGQMLYLDDFAGWTNDSKLSDLFGTFDTAKDKVIQELANSSFSEKLGKLSGSEFIDVSSNYADSADSLYKFMDDEFASVMTSLFLTYCCAYFNEADAKYEKSDNSDSFDFLDLKTHLGNFPNQAVEIDWASVKDSTTQEEVLSFLYYLLHPTEGISYVATWLKNKIGGFLLKWHEDVVGATDSNSSTGMTKYLGFSGYSTVPSLRDVSWVAKILDMYNSIIVYLIIIISLIMLCYVLTGSISIQRGIIGVLCFGLLAFFPPFAINATVDTSNKVSSTIYSDKFDYWALCQLQTYLIDYGNAKKAQKSGDMASYTAFVLSSQAERSSGIGGESKVYYGGVKLKWMSPKKYNTMAKVAESLSSSNSKASNSFLSSLVTRTLANQTSGENYVDDNGGALYLYRDYSDIHRYSSESYHVMDTFNYSGELFKDSSSLVKDNDFSGLIRTDETKAGHDKNTSVEDNINTIVKKLSIKKIEKSGKDKSGHDMDIVSGGTKSRFYSYTSSNVNILDLVRANTFDSATRRNNADVNPVINDCSSIKSIANGFLVDTIDYDKQFKDGKGSSIRYYNYTDSKQLNTLASAYLLNYSEGWSLAGLQKQRLKALANKETTISRSNIIDVLHKDSEVSSSSTSSVSTFTINEENEEVEENETPEANDVSDDANDTNSMNYTTYPTYYVRNVSLLGLPLDYYAGDVSGIQTIEGLSKVDLNNVKIVKNEAGEKEGPVPEYVYQNLSSYFYGLYSESPFYYFNFNLRDQIASDDDLNYSFDKDLPGDSGKSASSALNNVAQLMLKDNQGYFFNLKDSAGDGYGELRDFMNFHDFFYYIVPCMQQGVDLARLYDELFKFEVDDDCAVHYDSSVGQLVYKGKNYTVNEFVSQFYNKDGEFTEEEKYTIWHTLNNYSILNAYCAWLDTMMDCDYAKPETIHVAGKKYTVQNPLDPTSYFDYSRSIKKDSNGDVLKGSDGEVLSDVDDTVMAEGRYMVFSRSEMQYYGLTDADLTTVERKIIEVQDNVYKKALDLMNYYTFSDEVLIQALSMLETFEFNKVFSQESLFRKDYILYPQGYELKAFSYDAYLRLIVSEASGEDLMTSNTDGSGNTISNESLYTRVQRNTSLFFSIFLLLNDLVAVYVIPGFKLFFILLIFFSSVMLIVASAIKLEMNMGVVTWKSLIAPLLSFLGISIGLSVIISMFMDDGASGVISNGMTIELGDPTMAVIVILVINVIVMILYFKLVRKAFTDFKTFSKAVFSNIGGVVGGAIGKVASGFKSGVTNKFNGGLSDEGSAGGGAAATASQRGRDNSPISGKNGLASNMVAGAFGGGLAAGGSGEPGISNSSDMLTKAERRSAENRMTRENAKLGMNKWDRKMYERANAKTDKRQAKLDRAEHFAQKSANAHGGQAGKFAQFRLNYAKKKLERRQHHESDVAEYGRFRARWKQIGRQASAVGNFAGKVGDKAGQGASRLSELSSQARKNIGRDVKNFGAGAKNMGGKLKNGAKSLGDINTYYSAGNKVGTFGRNSVNNIKKGAGSLKRGVGNAVDKANNIVVRGSYAMQNARDSVSNGISKAGTTGRAVGRNTMYGIKNSPQALRNATRAMGRGLSNARDAAERTYIRGSYAAQNARNFAKEAGSATKAGLNDGFNGNK